MHESCDCGTGQNNRKPMPGGGRQEFLPAHREGGGGGVQLLDPRYLHSMVAQNTLHACKGKRF